jgi:hypothetical protein
MLKNFQKERESDIQRRAAPLKAHCGMDGGLYFTGPKDSSISSLTFPPHAWRVSVRYDQSKDYRDCVGIAFFKSEEGN